MHTRSILMLLLVGCAEEDADDDGMDEHTWDSVGASSGGGGGSGSSSGGSGSSGSTSGGSTSGGSTSGGSGSSGSSGSSGGSGSSSSGSSGGSTGPCPGYSGVGSVGDVRAWSTTAGYESTSGITGRWTMTTTRADADGDVELEYYGTWSGDDYTSTIDGTYSYRCDGDGMQLTEWSIESMMRTGGTDYESWTDATYSDPMLVMVHNAAPGTSWTDSSTYTMRYGSDSEVYTATLSVSTEYSVGQATTTTVPGGTFDTLPITSVTISNGASSTTTWWSDEAIGMVLSESGELDSHD